jgi:hypothetical protein
MGDAAAASSPTTPTSILICREDGNDIFLDFDDGADFSVAGDECLLVVDHDDEYFAVLLSKERASADAGAPAEEMDEWMKAARSGCVRWIIKVACALPSPFAAFTFLRKIRSFPLTRVRCAVAAGNRDVPVRREDGVRRGDLLRSVLGATES